MKHTVDSHMVMVTVLAVVSLMVLNGVNGFMRSVHTMAAMALSTDEMELGSAKYQFKVTTV